MLLSFITSVFCMTSMYAIDEHNRPIPNPEGFKKRKRENSKPPTQKVIYKKAKKQGPSQRKRKNRSDNSTNTSKRPKAKRRLFQ